MKKLFKISGLAYFALTLFSACEKLETPYSESLASKDQGKVYIARFTGNTQNLNIFPYQDEARTFEFSTAFGALGLSSNAINIKYAIDDKAFDSLNNLRTKQGLSLYEKFPADAYNISALNATIQPSSLNSNAVKVSYFSKKFNPSVDYLLPISIVNADGYAIGANKTIFIVAPKLEETMASKSKWTISSNSEELVGEGSSNGKATFAIDGNVNSYWHSQWQGTELSFPHWLTIDMKEDVYVTRIDLASRQNYTNGFRKFNIEASNDGANWVTLGTSLVMDPANKAFQSYPVTPGYRRYLKITMTEGYTLSTKSTNLAELNVYRY